MSAIENDINNIASANDAWAGYEPPSEFPRPADPGVYTFVRLNEKDTDFKSGEFFYPRPTDTSAGVKQKWYNFRSAIQGGPFNGRSVFGGANTMTSEYNRFATVQDYLVSAGSSARPALNDFAALDHAMAIASGPFRARIDWEWSCKGCKTGDDKPNVFLAGGRNPKSPKKYEGPKFALPKVEKTGLANHVQKCPSCQQEVAANAVIKSFLSTKTGAAPTTASAPVATTALPPQAG